MSVYEMFKTNPSLEKEGITLDYGSFSIRIARAGGHNSAFLKAMERESKPFRRAIQQETISADIAEEILRKVYADTVVLGWEGITDEDGNVLQFSKENCVKLFRDLPDLFNEIKETANKMAVYREVAKEEESKN
jgi:hypothetical protein